MVTAMKNTVITYAYTDKSGRTARHCVVVHGSFPDDGEAVRACCNNSSQFYPRLVGLPDLKTHVHDNKAEPNLETQWHVLETIKTEFEQPTITIDTVTLLSAFEKARANEWPDPDGKMWEVFNELF